MSTIAQIIFGLVCALLVILSIRLIALKKKVEELSRVQTNSRIEIVSLSHPGPNVFEAPKLLEFEEVFTASQEYMESDQEFGLPDSRIEKKTAEISQNVNVAINGPEQIQAFITQLPPAESASPQELIAIIGNFLSPVPERLKAIKRVSELQLTEAVPILIETLYEPDMMLSTAAADVLGQLGDPRAIEPLMEITHRNDEMLVQEVQKLSVEKTDSNEDSTAQPSNELLPTVNPFRYRESTILKIDILPNDYFQEDGSLIPRRELVLKGLKDSDQQLRQIAAKAAIGLNDPAVVPVLVEALSNTSELESVRCMAAEALGEIGDEAGSEALFMALQDDNVAVRYSTAAALSKMGGAKAIEALIKALEDSNEFVRSSAVYALGKIGDKNVVKALLEKTTDSSEVVRFSVGKALADLSDDEILEELEQRLEEAGADVRCALMDVLSQIKCDKSVELIRKALRDKDSETNFKASMAAMNLEAFSLLDDLIEVSKRFDDDLMKWLQNVGSNFG